MKFKIILVTILISSFLTPTAQAADKGWRYWGYFHAAPKTSTWTVASTGPTVDIADGAVEGWSFVFESDDIPSQLPSVNPDFKSICKGAKFDKDSKRVGLVINFGSAIYAPKGEKVQKTITTCVRVSNESQGIDVLGQVVKVRADGSGFICGLAGYPGKECATEIATPKALIKKK